METCMLCLELVPAVGGINIFSDEGLILNIVDILKKLFPFLSLLEDQQQSEHRICHDCRLIVSEFNEFYQRINSIHLLKTSQNINVSKNIDPFPSEICDKANNQETTDFIRDVGGQSLLDFNEIKVEVNDLELLPQIEVLENPLNSNINFSAQQGIDTKKHVKQEEPPQINLNKCDPVNNVHIEDSFSVNVEVNLNKTSKESGCVYNLDKGGMALRKRRGKSAKINKFESLNKVAANAGLKNKISDEDVDDADDSVEYRENSSYFCEFDDNASEEHWVEIPKQAIVKPKKYRKREKPLIPPSRMSREEIDRRKAKQDEYDDIISKFFKKFQCPQCNLLVKNFGDLRRHFRISHKIDTGYMSCCGKKFHLRKTLAEHVMVHWDPEHFKCKTCCRAFHDSRSLETHENSHVNPRNLRERKVFQCDKCPKAFTTKAAFEYHTFSKHVPKSEFKFSCMQCNKKLPTERKLKDHMKYVHDPESAIICDKCGKKVRTQSNLKRHHQLEHSDEPRTPPIPMQCEICGTWLRHAAGLKQHMKTIHEQSGGEHKCHICNKKSTNARALKRHVYHNHQCERKFKCTMCEKAFKRPQDLREHTSTHTGEVLYTCPNCPMTFFSNANMYKHRQRLHRAEWEADRKKPNINIMRQAVGATAAMKLRAAIGSNIAYFTKGTTNQNSSTFLEYRQL